MKTKNMVISVGIFAVLVSLFTVYVGYSEAMVNVFWGILIIYLGIGLKE